jgi:predicted transcriptional regulator
MNRSCYTALNQASNAVAINLPYKPHSSFGNAVNRLVLEGLIAKLQTGGFCITEAGQRTLRATRTHRTHT